MFFRSQSAQSCRISSIIWCCRKPTYIFTCIYIRVYVRRGWLCICNVHLRYYTELRRMRELLAIIQEAASCDCSARRTRHVDSDCTVSRVLSSSDAAFRATWQPISSFCPFFLPAFLLFFLSVSFSEYCLDCCSCAMFSYSRFNLSRVFNVYFSLFIYCVNLCAVQCAFVNSGISTVNHWTLIGLAIFADHKFVEKDWINV